MPNPLSRRVEHLEQQQPTGLPIVVWCKPGCDVDALVAQAKAEHPGRTIITVRWLDDRDSQGKNA